MPIQKLGLLNPVTIDKEKNLIAGLHRLEAVKHLGRAEVEYTLSSLDGLQAELVKIDENFVRSGLFVVEHLAVNRVVVGSSPARGVKRQRDDAWESP